MSQELFSPRAKEPHPRTSARARAAERRSQPRYPISAAATVLEESTRARLLGRASDLGTGGCYVDTITPFPVGTAVHVQLASGGRSFYAAANVMYTHPGMGMGLAFSEMGPEQAAALREWLAEVTGEPAASFHIPSATGGATSHGTADEATGAEAAVEALIGLMTRKGLLTSAEADSIRAKLASREGAEEAAGKHKIPSPEGRR